VDRKESLNKHAFRLHLCSSLRIQKEEKERERKGKEEKVRRRKEGVKKERWKECKTLLA